MLDSPIEYERLLPRVHVWALGIAVGTTAALAVFVLTAVHLLAGLPGNQIGLLSQYLYGYDVTWPGAFVGVVWMWGYGFVGGCALAVAHNVAMRLWLFVVRTRTELSQQRNLIDHLR